ncbi:glycosyl hydrolase family 28-related protein [Streptomyces sp. NPDC058466]|uniref:glycosyl hydrolase family 28-related protein n=1 Tax=Streptomyces sp. NPDC058466 TaxID=3346512 RepID=UPI00364EB816
MKLQVTGEQPVDAIDVTGGQQPTIIDVTAGTVTSVNGRTGAVTISSSDVGAPDWINAVQRGAHGDGIHDDTTAIQAAIDACQPGGIVYLPRGVYKTTATLDLKAGVTLLGSHSNLMLGPGMTGDDYPCYIQPQGPFTGSSVIQIVGEDDGIHPAISGEQRIINLMIDGSQLTGTAVDGLYAKGNVQNVVLEGVTIRQMPNNGIVTAPNSAGQYPFSWRMRHVMVDGCHAHGFLFTRMTDLTAIDCQAIGSWANGWVLTNLPNSEFTNCRAEWCGNHGFVVTGDWGSGTGSGGATFTGCSTDRNGWDGVHVNATGNGPLQFTSLMTRRDGRNGGAGGGGYAGLAANGATVPLIIGDWTNYPGVDDNGAGTNSPQYGGSFTNSTFVQVDNAYLHAATAGLKNGGGNTTLQCRNVTYATGATSSPARTTPQTSALGWVSVKDPAYGATGDGVTDDTAAIQAAINSLGSQGGTVYLPPGSYLLNGSSGLSISTNAVTLRGAGPEASKILIGSGFTGSTAISVTDSNAQVMDLSVNGASSTTASNPAAHGVTVSGARRLKVLGCQFWYLNGYAVRALATNAGSTTNPHGTQISNVRINQCAGGIHFLGNTTQGYAVNSFVTDVHIQQGGVATGSSANLDGIRIEDAWDVLVENAITWLQAGTGSALHVIGNCAASFIKNLDALGPNGLAPNVLVEDGANGSPQNVQISGGVIQQGTVGIKISGGAQHVHVDSLRIINNTGHGAQVDGTGAGIYFHKVFFSQSGQGATGTNYDINWSGTTTGHILNCRFSSPIVTTGTAGVQQTINVAAGQSVRVLAADFQGSGAASTNWFTNFPMVVTHVDGANMEHIGNLDFRLPTNARVSLRPVAAGNNALAINVNGSDSVDRYRLLGDGSQQYGTGAATRDTTWGRQGVAQIGTPDSDIIIGLAGKGLRIKEGTNAKMGTAVLVGGTKAVATTAVTATSRIYVTSNADGGTPGWLRVSTRTAGTSFTIQSSSASDTSTVAWMIVEPA